MSTSLSLPIHQAFYLQTFLRGNASFKYSLILEEPQSSTVLRLFIEKIGTQLNCKLKKGCDFKEKPLPSEVVSQDHITELGIYKSPSQKYRITVERGQIPKFFLKKGHHAESFLKFSIYKIELANGLEAYQVTSDYGGFRPVVKSSIPPCTSKYFLRK